MIGGWRYIVIKNIDIKNIYNTYKNKYKCNLLNSLFLFIIIVIVSQEFPFSLCCTHWICVAHGKN